MVGGVPIGQAGDGVAYLRFLTSLKAKVGTKSVSIAAPLRTCTSRRSPSTELRLSLTTSFT